MFQQLLDKSKSISVTGLGYVGLPLALEFAKHFRVIGFDINESRIALMKQHIDPSKELKSDAFENCDIEFTTNPADLKKAHFHIIGVPTDIDVHKVPNLNPLKGASRSVGEAIKKGDYVVYESTVYPGCTEEDCLPIIEEISGLKAGKDFKYGYSPERINPGDKERTLTKILKIVSGNDTEALEEIAKVYEHIITAGVYKAPSVKVAEAAKVIENSQRDINISFVNELSIIFDKMGIKTQEVLKAAGTKWNFLPFQPGLVGGHCIGVDPFYLMHKAKQMGIDPQVIAAGRRVNDYMPGWIAKKLVQNLIEKGKNPSHCKILLMGITFKENVSDIRNSKVIDIFRELKDYSLIIDVVDEFASNYDVKNQFDLELSTSYRDDYDAIIVAVPHDAYKKLSPDFFKSKMKIDKPMVFDLKGICNWEDNEEIEVWSL